MQNIPPPAWPKSRGSGEGEEEDRKGEEGEEGRGEEGGQRRDHHDHRGQDAAHLEHQERVVSSRGPVLDRGKEEQWTQVDLLCELGNSRPDEAGQSQLEDVTCLQDRVLETLWDEGV